MIKLFDRGSRSHILLLIAQSQRGRWFDKKVAFKVSNHFAQRDSAMRAAKKLIEAGLLEKKSEGPFHDSFWRITPRGSQYLMDFAVAFPAMKAGAPPKQRT